MPPTQGQVLPNAEAERSDGTGNRSGSGSDVRMKSHAGAARQSADGARGMEPESISLGLKEDRQNDEDDGDGFF